MSYPFKTLLLFFLFLLQLYDFYDSWTFKCYGAFSVNWKVQISGFLVVNFSWNAQVVSGSWLGKSYEKSALDYRTTCLGPEDSGSSLESDSAALLKCFSYFILFGPSEMLVKHLCSWSRWQFYITSIEILYMSNLNDQAQFWSCSRLRLFHFTAGYVRDEVQNSRVIWREEHLQSDAVFLSALQRTAVTYKIR